MNALIKNEPRPFDAAETVALDYETTGFHPRSGARAFAFSLTWVDTGYTEVWRENGAVRFYFDEVETGRLQLGAGDYQRRLADFWKSPCGMVAHNLKFEWEFTRAAGLEVNPRKILHDTMIMSQYVDNLCPKHSLDYLFNRFHGKIDWISEIDKEVEHAAKILGTYDKIPEDIMFRYQLADGIRGALLYRTFWPHVVPSTEYFNEIELIKATAKMEDRGFMLDKEQAKLLMLRMQKELIENNDKAQEIVGRFINLNSEKQLKHFLFEELGLPRTETTDKRDIVKIDHPIVDCVLKARAYTKGVAIIRGYMKMAKAGVIHPSIITNRAGTGRESSENPNVQNVAKEIKAGTKYTVPARRCFRARPGYVLLLADYAGIEMRLAVQGTGDARLMAMCRKDFDFHDACARAFYGDRYIDEKDKDMKKALRSRAKNARFAMLYGAGLEQTALTLGLTVEEVRAGYERDKKDFPEFYQLMDDCTHRAKRNGHITTFFGRKLRVPLDRPYAATDYLIQGSAAALFKHAQVAVDKYFSSIDGCHILIPVHDELVMEIKRGIDLKKICRNVKRLMIDRPEITVKLDVEFSVSTYTWDAKNEYKPDLGL